MTGFWKVLFSAPEAIEKVADAAIRTGDALVYTDEEKAQASQLRMEWFLRYLDASKGSNLARRWIAIMTVSVFLFLIIIDALSILTGFGDAKALFSLISDTLVWPTGVIMAFYFAAGMVRDSRQKK